MLDYLARHYIHNVLGFGAVEIIDAPEAAVLIKDGQLLRIDGRYQMKLPVSEESFLQVFGKGADQLSIQQKAMLLFGLIYHEIGHLISGEPLTTSRGFHVIYNIINDANENTILPAYWLGSIHYLQMVNDLMFHRVPDLGELPENDSLSLLKKLLTAMTVYRPCVCFKYDGEVAYSFPVGHPLSDIWFKVKQQLRRARKEYSLDEVEMERIRLEIINETIQVMKEWWKDDGHEDETGLSLEEALEKLHPEVQPQAFLASGSGDSDLSDMIQIPEDVGKDIDKLIRDVARTIAEEQLSERSLEDYLQEADEKSSRGHGTGSVRPSVASEPWPVDTRVAHELRNKMRRITFVRRHDRRHAEVTGNKLHPANFYQIKTNPEAPRIFRARTRIREAPVLTEFYFMMDRSGSMRGDREDVCRDIMATFYEALRLDRQVRLNIAGFDTEVYEVDITNNAQYVLRQIAGYLKSGGGTDYPKAMRHALGVLERSSAEKKVLVMLTDGDLKSNAYDPFLLYHYAKLRGIHVITIKLGSPIGTDFPFCDQQIALYDVRELPNLMAQISLREV